MKLPVIFGGAPAQVIVDLAACVAAEGPAAIDHVVSQSSHFKVHGYRTRKPPCDSVADL